MFMYAVTAFLIFHLKKQDSVTLNTVNNDYEFYLMQVGYWARKQSF